MASFGHSMKDQFLLSDDYTFINHGSYGAVAKPVHEAKLRKQEGFEAVPDLWFRRQYQEEYKENSRAAAEFLGANPDDVALVSNTTAGINAVLRSLVFGPGDAILLYTWSYGAVKMAVKWVTERSGAEILCVDVPLPIKDKQQVIDAYTEMVTKHSNIKLAIIDGISSVPAILMPFREVTAVCRARGIEVLLDGAHMPGQVDVQLDQWDVDYFVGNLHKWAYTPRGCAVLYVKAAHRDRIRPPVASFCTFFDGLQDRFFYQGTDDHTTFCVVKDAIKFYRDLGGLETIVSYNNDLVNKAADMLATRWGTRTMEIPRDMQAPCMRMVQVPDLAAYPATVWDKNDPLVFPPDQRDLIMKLMDRFRTIIIFITIDGHVWTRISANVYNIMDDFEKFADAILLLKEEDDGRVY